MTDEHHATIVSGQPFLLLGQLYHGARTRRRPPARPCERARATQRPRMALALLLGLIAGCGPRAEPRSSGPRAHDAEVPSAASDTGRTLPLPLALQGNPAARVWLSRVRRAAPVTIAPGPARPPAVPEPEPAQLPDTGATAAVSDALLPPVLRTPGTLVLPPGAAHRAWVDLDVHVSASGDVDQVRWSGGSGERAQIDAASQCARTMRFFPAEQAGRPVAVWCTQRFEFGPPGR